MSLTAAEQAYGMQGLVHMIGALDANIGTNNKRLVELRDMLNDNRNINPENIWVQRMRQQISQSNVEINLTFEIKCINEDAPLICSRLCAAKALHTMRVT